MPRSFAILNRFLVAGSLLLIVAEGCGGGSGGSAVNVSVADLVGTWTDTTMAIGAQTTGCPGTILHGGITSSCAADVYVFNADGTAVFDGQVGTWTLSANSITISVNGSSSTLPITMSPDKSTLSFTQNVTAGSNSWTVILTFVKTAAVSSASIVNGGFETNNVGTGFLYSSTSPAADPKSVVAFPWQFSGVSGIAHSNGQFAGNAADGSYFAFLQSSGNYGSSVWQTVSGFTVGQQYTLSFQSVQRPASGVGATLTVTANGSVLVPSFLPGSTWGTTTAQFTATSTTETFAWTSPLPTTQGTVQTSYIDAVSVH